MTGLQIAFLVIFGLLVFMFLIHWWDIKKSEVSFEEFEIRLNQYINALIQKGYIGRCIPTFDYKDGSSFGGYRGGGFLFTLKKKKQKGYVISETFYITKKQYIASIKIKRWNNWEKESDGSRVIIFRMDIK